jgi:fructose/tagatose bisphosphate aldolase
MAIQQTAGESLFGADVQLDTNGVRILREAALTSERMDALVNEAVFARGQPRDHARWLVWELAQSVGLRPASINDLYLARGRGEVGGFTVPAINVRGMAYDTARSIFRTAKRHNVGAFILEIARSEIGYTDQRPAEYVAVILGAALREGFRGPVFIQGDHFQVNGRKFATDPAGEVAAVKQLAYEAIHAGFYNIDVDTSTLVDTSLPTLDAQQRTNYETAAEIVAYLRETEPAGVTLSVGGEIGEVGTQNSTVPELRAFMDGLRRRLAERCGTATVGLSKISVQSGTSHGGVVLPDGTIAEVKLNFATLGELGRVAREVYGLAGAVQHGASTLPPQAFNNFPLVETAEIHLATNFQNILYDNLPAPVRDEIYEWLRVNAKDERRANDSDEQFFYKTRKKALGPFKARFWELPSATKDRLAAAYDGLFGFLFQQLGVGDTMDTVARYIKAPAEHRRSPAEGASSVTAAPDDTELSD